MTELFTTAFPMLGKAQAGEVQVVPMRGYYLVSFRGGDERHSVLVTHDRRCLYCTGTAGCHGVSECPGLEAVARFLHSGGAPAGPSPQRLIPPLCPICGGAIRHVPRLSSRRDGPGWACLALAERDVRRPLWAGTPGEGHFHQWRVRQGPGCLQRTRRESGGVP